MIPKPSDRVLHGYRLIMAYEQYHGSPIFTKRMYPRYPSFTLFSHRLLRDEPLARAALTHGLYARLRNRLGLTLLEACENLQSAYRAGLWGWGRFAKTSVEHLVKFTLDHAWEVAELPTFTGKRQREIVDHDPAPVYPREEGGFTPRPEDDYLDYGSFIPRRVHVPPI